MTDKKIRVRFPPSPTGYCHVGTARMAILNYLFAKKHGGEIVFRSEDTDKERSTREFEDDIVEQIKWLGLNWDEFYRTSELVEEHKKALQRIIDEDKAYISSEESKKEPGKTVEVVRLRNPGRSVTFTDEIRGDITFDTTELGDFVIARAIDDPLYQFAVVEDDGRMGITHVIRGEDHISNTPRQILIQEALGYPRPVYAHYPLLLGADKSKLSKRTGDVAVRSYREKGYLPEALLNYIAVLGWTPPSEKEILSLEEMIAEFDLKDQHKSGAVFDLEKLQWFNRHYIMRLSDDDFARYAEPTLKRATKERQLTWIERIGKRVLGVIRERISNTGDINDLAAAGEFDYFFTDPVLDVKLIPHKDSTPKDAAGHLHTVRACFADVSVEDFGRADSIKDTVWDYATEKGRGAVLWPLRYALSGREKSADPFTIAAVIGKEATVRRIDTAIEILGGV